MSDVDLTIARGREVATPVHKVLRNTYLLLSMTLLFSTVCAVAAMAVGLSPGAALFMVLGAFVCLFVVQKTARSAAGLIWIFVFTGLMGASLGPTLTYYIQGFTNGPMIVAQALGGTGVIFLSLSGYALVSGRNFSNIGGFLMTGLIVAIIAMIANIFLKIPALDLAISSAVVLIMSGLILFHTSNIINGGERNYILATMSLYLAIYNIFVHLLHLLAVLSGRE